MISIYDHKTNNLSKKINLLLKKIPKYSKIENIPKYDIFDLI